MTQKQARLPGTEETLIKEIVDAAEAYKELRDERMELTKRESDAQQALLNAMRRNDLDEYNFDGLRCYIIHGKDKVKVRSSDEEQEESEE
ncbi:hypothetical protein L0152_07350 [bacterium]|nr:hypothetical protein [bacterium]